MMLLVGLFFDALVFGAAAVTTGLLLGVRPGVLMSLGVPSAGLRQVVPFLCGGVAVYAVAALLFIGGYARMERPTSLILVQPGSPAERAGLRDGDRIVAVDGHAVETFEALSDRIRPHAAKGSSVRLTLARGGEEVAIVPEEGRIGIMAGEERISMPLSEAIAVGVTAPVRTLWMTGRAVTTLIAGERPFETLGGPVLLYAGGASASGGSLLLLAALPASMMLPLFVLLGVLLAAITAARQRAQAGVR